MDISIGHYFSYISLVIWSDQSQISIHNKILNDMNMLWLYIFEIFYWMWNKLYGEYYIAGNADFKHYW